MDKTSSGTITKKDLIILLGQDRKSASDIDQLIKEGDINNSVIYPLIFFHNYSAMDSRVCIHTLIFTHTHFHCDLGHRDISRV